MTHPVFKRLAALSLALLLLAVAVGCDDSKVDYSETETQTFDAYATDAPSLNADMEAIRQEIDSRRVMDFTETARRTEYVKITVRDYGEVVIRLRGDIAPETVENFTNLVQKGFYDGLTVFRVIKGFAIQTGDPKGDGSGGSDTPVLGEFINNGVQNDLSHIPGVVTMARKAEQYNSATSQFMICSGPDAAATLDGANAAFGYVVAGMEVILAISEVEVTLGSGEISRPVEPIVIEKICFVKDR